MTTSGLPRRFETAYRMVAASFVFAILWDAPFYPWLYQVHAQWQVVDSFFPRWTHVPALHAALFTTLTGLSLVVVLWPNRVMLRLHALSTGPIAFLLLTGPFLFARQLLVIILWSSIWLLWMVFRIDQKDPARSARVGGLLSLAIISFVFFGAVVGKMTEGYWSGEAMFYLFFAIQDDSKFRLLREVLSPEQLALVATWYSRVAVVGEFCIAGSVLLPLRFGLPVALLLVIGMWMASPVGIINAVGAAIGLLSAGMVLSLLPAAPEEDAGGAKA